LTEALAKQHGFVGLADGLELLRRLIEECWERIYPSIEDGDLEVRAGPFNWLGESDRGARFPPALRTFAIVRGTEGAYGWMHWRQAQDGKGKTTVTREAFDKATQSTTREQAQEVVDAIARATRELNALAVLLNERLAGVAPGMSDLRSALADCSTLAEQVLKLKGPAPTEEAPAEDGQAGEGEGGGGTSARTGRAMATRADVYQRLGEAANLLEQMEPHSPVPYLVRKAVELGGLPFPQLMKALIREEYGQALIEMNRELGIKEPPPPG
jgi:type VI secretion system protein ImpA